MTAAHVLAADGGTNCTVIGVLLAIFVPICAAIAAIVGWYYRLQRHRADAVAMASYRKLAALLLRGPLTARATHRDKSISLS